MLCRARCHEWRDVRRTRGPPCSARGATGADSLPPVVAGGAVLNVLQPRRYGRGERASALTPRSAEWPSPPIDRCEEPGAAPAALARTGLRARPFRHERVIIRKGPYSGRLASGRVCRTPRARGRGAGSLRADGENGSPRCPALGNAQPRSRTVHTSAGLNEYPPCHRSRRRGARGPALHAARRSARARRACGGFAARLAPIRSPGPRVLHPDVGVASSKTPQG